jgi:malic enzyme
VGTNNESLLKDPFYLGLQHKRVTGDAYLATVDEFIRAMRERFPKALIQFEDFSNENAARLLEFYRHKVLCFNDDIQGTGTVALAGVLGALRAAGHSEADALSKQRIVIVGAGTAGLGVANALRMGMVAQGLSDDEARSRIYLIDQNGLLGHSRPNLDVNQRPWVKFDQPDRTSVETLMETVKPSILMGLTGNPGVFSEKAIRTMAQFHKRPIVFPLSNPTSRAEATAKDVYEWTDGQAIFASGSPFDPVTDRSGVLRYPSQANNFYCFVRIHTATGQSSAHKLWLTFLLPFLLWLSSPASVSEPSCPNPATSVTTCSTWPHEHWLPL